MLKSLDKNLKKIYKFSGYIAAAFLILVAVFILIGISSRIFGFYIRGLAEYSGYCMASASFFALAYTFVEGGHIRITLFLEKLSGKKKWITEIARANLFPDDVNIARSRTRAAAIMRQSGVLTTPTGPPLPGESSMLMTVVLHFATALSTVVIFRKELLQIIKGLFQFQWNDASKFSVKIIISMIPAALVGVFFDDIIESFFDGAILLVGSMLLVTGALLFLADKTKNTTKEVSFFHSIIIGISQAIAILPGISRSGATIGTSVLLGIDREKAARFSFLHYIDDDPVGMDVDVCARAHIRLDRGCAGHCRSCC